MIRRIFKNFSTKSRQKRARIFREHFPIRRDTLILDLGSEDGSNISFVLQETDFEPHNIYIADIDKRALEKGAKDFGFNPVLLDESGKLPFADEFFDIVYCSSVIEHATVAKNEIWKITSGKKFRETSLAAQKAFADEIRRVGKSYFVQTPSRNFPIESHSWLPLASFLPRPILLKTLKTSNRFWIKKTVPDYNLLDRKEMKKLFPEAKILTEKKFGLVKSIIAIKN